MNATVPSVTSGSGRRPVSASNGSDYRLGEWWPLPKSEHRAPEWGIAIRSQSNHVCRTCAAIRPITFRRGCMSSDVNAGPPQCLCFVD